MLRRTSLFACGCLALASLVRAQDPAGYLPEYVASLESREYETYAPEQPANEFLQQQQATASGIVQGLAEYLETMRQATRQHEQFLAELRATLTGAGPLREHVEANTEEGASHRASVESVLVLYGEKRYGPMPRDRAIPWMQDCIEAGYLGPWRLEPAEPTIKPTGHIRAAIRAARPVKRAGAVVRSIAPVRRVYGTVRKARPVRRVLGGGYLLRGFGSCAGGSCR